MKVTYTVIFTLACVGAIHALPTQSSKKINDDVEIVPGSRQSPFDPTIVDTGSFFGDGPSNFGGFFNSFDGVLKRMREQMDALLNRFSGGANGTIGFPNLGDIDLSKGNTTSVTKVIDGHKVVINETEYKKDNDFGGAFFKIRIIDVKPDSSESTTKTDTENVPTRDVEPLEGSFENEIPKSREAIDYNNIETFDEIDQPQPPSQKVMQKPYEWDQLEPLEDFDDNALPEKSLSNDIYINQLMGDAGAPTNPDAEFVFLPTPQKKP